MPSASTRLTEAFLYSFPVTVLKSSASARDAENATKITNVVAHFFTLGPFCFFRSPHRNDKVI
jgi:hypothetical protein